MQITVAILAGGLSSRMGTDKAALEWEGKTLLERTARTALDAGLPVLVAGRPRPDGWPLAEIAFVPDRAAGRGPLGGLETALRHAQSPILALACDLPLLQPADLHWLASQLAPAGAAGGPHGLAVRSAGRWEPLFSVYAPACLPLIESRLLAGRLSLHGLIEAGEFGVADAPDHVAAHLVNVNTPGDLARLRGATEPRP